MAVAPSLRFTYDDYLLLPEDRRYEILDGDLFTTPTPTPLPPDRLEESRSLPAGTCPAAESRRGPVCAMRRRPLEDRHPPARHPLRGRRQTLDHRREVHLRTAGPGRRGALARHGGPRHRSEDQDLRALRGQGDVDRRPGCEDGCRPDKLRRGIPARRSLPPGRSFCAPRFSPALTIPLDEISSPSK